MLTTEPKIGIPLVQDPQFLNQPGIYSADYLSSSVNADGSTLSRYRMTSN
jgi:hypothetical protein